MRAAGQTADPSVSRRGVVLAGASIVGIAAAGVAGYAVWSGRSSAGGSSAGEKIRYNARSGNDHEGALFVPPPSATPPPLLLLLDPGGAALGIVNRYAPAAARNGWMLASSFQIRNGTSDDNDIDELTSLRDSLVDTHRFDEARVYLGGMSGAATTGYQFAVEWSNKFRGAISECGQMAGWRKVRGTAKGSSRSSFYLFTCSGDFNRDATRTLYAEMTKTGYRTKLVERDTGGHEPMRPDEIDDALVWLGAAG